MPKLSPGRPMPDMTEEQMSNIRMAEDTCWICEEEMSEEDRVIDHDHVSGKILGVAHSVCNLQRKEVPQLTCFAHNFSGESQTHVFGGRKLRGEDCLFFFFSNSDGAVLEGENSRGGVIVNWPIVGVFFTLELLSSAHRCSSFLSASQPSGIFEPPFVGRYSILGGGREKGDTSCVYPLTGRKDSKTRWRQLGWGNSTAMRCGRLTN